MTSGMWAVAENTLSLNKTLVLFVVASVAMIGAAIFATMPTAGPLQAHERTARAMCHTDEISLDQGYGVSRVVERRVCDDY